MRPKDELLAASQAVVESDHRKKLILAGAGAGKTSTFRALLTRLGNGDRGRRVVLTFINGLRDDLDLELGSHARVQTFHGFCHALLREKANVRAAAGMSSNFGYSPNLVKLIKGDWEIVHGDAAPKFVPDLRHARNNGELQFFLARGRYYDVVGYEDSIAHVHQVFREHPECIPEYDLVVVDEYQDFNKAEVETISFLASRSPVAIAGDDDQALYGQLRDASEEYIRELYRDAEYQTFTLPICARCPSAVVHATNMVIAQADKLGVLGSRIPKRYEPWPRAEIDRPYPRLKLVEVSRQNNRVNYFGKYVLEEIQKIPQSEVADSREKRCPTVLLIAAPPYGEQVRAYLEAKGIIVQTREKPATGPSDLYTLEDGLADLRRRPDSNFGWRIVLEVERPQGYQDWIRKTIDGTPLQELIDKNFRDSTMRKLSAFSEEAASEESAEDPVDEGRATVRLTTFQGAKGMSAHHVFILGAEDGKLPYKPRAIKSLEVRKMIVALTRTRRQCHLLYAAARTVGKKHQRIRPSIFVRWIDPKVIRKVRVDASYWRRG